MKTTGVCGKQTPVFFCGTGKGAVSLAIRGGFGYNRENYPLCGRGSLQ